MRCPSCQHDNDDTKKFCTSCGAALGGRKCANGHTIPDGLTDCPFCPRPIRAPTAVDPNVAAAPPLPPPPDLRRKATAVVSPTELERSGVQVSPQVGRAPVPPVAPGVAAAPGGRGKTVFRSAGEADAPAVPAATPQGQARAAVAPLVGFLVTFSLDEGGQFWPIRFGRTVIGSDPSSDVVLAVPGVSGRHAEVMVRDNRGAPKIWVSDCNSTNGTQLNGADIFTDRPDLGSGDVLTLSSLALTVVLLPRTG